jgi:hypothetical protein
MVTVLGAQLASPSCPTSEDSVADPVVLINILEVPDSDAEEFIAAWERTRDYLQTISWPRSSSPWLSRSDGNGDDVSPSIVCQGYTNSLHWTSRHRSGPSAFPRPDVGDQHRATPGLKKNPVSPTARENRQRDS